MLTYEAPIVEVQDQASKNAVKFKNGQRLLINQGGSEESIELSTNSGQLLLTIKLTEDGPEINLSGEVLKINAVKKIEITSPVIDIHAKDELRLRSGGDLRQVVKNDVYSVARIQNLTADLGNVNIKANDNVRLNGERVHLNCEEEY